MRHLRSTDRERDRAIQAWVAGACFLTVLLIFTAAWVTGGLR